MNCKMIRVYIFFMYCMISVVTVRYKTVHKVSCNFPSNVTTEKSF